MTSPFDPRVIPQIDAIFLRLLLKLFPKVSIFTNFPLSILVGMKNKDKQDKKGNRSVSKKHSA